jgi:hypothetical protein
VATLDMLAVGIASALRPLVFTTQSEEGIRNAVEHLGWTLPEGPVPAALTELAEDLQQLYPLLVEVTDALNDAEVGEPLADVGDTRDVDAMAAELALNLTLFIERLHGLPAQLATQLPGAYVADTRIADEFTERLFDRMLSMELEREHVLLKALLSFAGIIERSVEPAAPERFQPAFTRYRIHWNRLWRLFDPASLMRELYGWGTPQIDSARLFAEVMPLSFALCMPAELRYATTSFAQKVTPGVLPTDPPAAQFWLPVYRAEDASLHVAMTVLPKATSEELQGLALALVPSAVGNVSLPFGTDLQLNMEASAQVGTGAALILRPDRAPQVVLDVEGAAESLGGGRVAAALVWKAPEAATQQGVAANGGTTLTAGSISIGVGAEANGSQLTAFADLSIKEGKLSVASPREDGFLSSVLPKSVAAPFSFTLRWSQDGLQFRGGAGLSTTLSMNVSVGAVRVQSLTLGIELSQDSLMAEASLAVSFNLGPAVLTLDRIGFAADARSTNGNLGGADLDLRFKPPSGVGLVVDASAVVGGGYLFFDTQRGEYSGMVQLEIAGRISVKAFGLLHTRLPDGTRGYSLIVLITAEDFQPIPLGMGFNLLGIGGLLAVNRTFNEMALRENLKNNTLATLLFPRDPVANAAQILRNLAMVFPAKPGSYLFGPLAKIGWASPTLIEMNLALILEFGARQRLIALGRISSILPTREHGLIRLNMDALGILDFDEGTVSLDAVLVDSRLVEKFVLSGSMALRACLVPGPQAGFALAVGGMNPHYTSPAGMPALDRIAISLTSGDNPRLTCDAYFAVTPNTIQFGARAMLYAAAHGFSVQGDVGFDVLIQLIPFHFIADFQASLQLRAGSRSLFKVKVKGELEGPRPLRVSATATFEIFWCDVSISFDKTLIEGEKPPLPPAVDVLDELLVALCAPASWSTELPPQHHGVTMRRLPPNTPFALDPLGELTVKQTVVPLNTSRDLDRFGGAPLGGARRFTVTGTIVGLPADDAAPTHPARDLFAPAQFFDLTDEERLASPSFEEMDSGLVFTSSTFSIDPAGEQRADAPLEFDTLILDTDTAQSAPKYTLGLDRLRRQARFGSVAQASACKAGIGRFRNDAAPRAATLVTAGWCITSTTDLSAVPANAPATISWGDARALVKSLKRDVTDTTQWQSVPVYEVVS